VEKRREGERGEGAIKRYEAKGRRGRNLGRRESYDANEASSPHTFTSRGLTRATTKRRKTSQRKDTRRVTAHQLVSHFRFREFASG
jgi:hypothetical protein